MALRVAKAGEVVGAEVVITGKAQTTRVLAGGLTSLEDFSEKDGPAWGLPLTIGEGREARRIVIALSRFLSASAYAATQINPVLIYPSGPAEDVEGFIYLFRDKFFVTERVVRTSQEEDEVLLRIKKLAYDEEGELVALRSYVSNVEAALDYQRAGPKREAIAEDVKLLVWSRDGGACTRCCSRERLHFDHIIPVVKGGGGDANNIQLLCQACNLRKSDRIAF